ncbi:MAG: DUF3429 domain-containing protein [Hyphomicrobiales bacterium]
MTVFSEDPVQSNQEPSKLASWLGYTGLIPFVAAAIGTFVFRSDIETQVFLGTTLLVYGAVLLSFLGGIRWGTALSIRNRGDQMRQLCFSVLPTLLGWICVLLPSQSIALMILAIGFSGQLYFDLHSTAQELLPRWFGKLRIQLTVGAVISLIFGSMHLM